LSFFKNRSPDGRKTSARLRQRAMSNSPLTGSAERVRRSEANGGRVENILRICPGPCRLREFSRCCLGKTPLRCIGVGNILGVPLATLRTGSSISRPPARLGMNLRGAPLRILRDERIGTKAPTREWHLVHLPSQPARRVTCAGSRPWETRNSGGFTRVIEVHYRWSASIATQVNVVPRVPWQNSTPCANENGPALSRARPLP
jgi:hypothetical protein